MPRRWLQFHLRTLLLAQIAVAAGIVTFPYWSTVDLRPVEKRPIAWQPYSETALDEAKASGRPVMVHYYATWTMTSVYAWKLVLETPAIRRSIVDDAFIPLLVDCTELDDETKAALDSHNIDSIPVTMIYSPDAPEQPIILHDIPSQIQVLTAMKQAALSGDERPRWNPFMSPLVGGLGVVFLIGLAHVLARTQR